MSKTTVDQKVLGTAIKGIIARLEKTEKFALEQAPEICKQMVAESLFNIRVDFVCSLLFNLFTLGLAAVFVHIAVMTESTDLRVGMSILGIAAGVGWLVASACVVESIKQFYYLTKCPKLFLLREFKRLVRK